jgi:predicted amidophosphoribosyltransferase
MTSGTARVWWDDLQAAAADLLLGAACWSCGEPGRSVCEGCRRELSSYPLTWAEPRPRPDGYPATVAAAAYEGPAATLIRAHKEHQARGVRPVLAERLARAIAAARDQAALNPATEVLLVPVPSSAAAVRTRGEDVTKALATAAAAMVRNWGASVRVAAILGQRREVLDQAGLSAGDRAENLSGALTVRRRIDPARPVLVVDDVTTTGSTLAEAARVLQTAGCRVLGAATIAATQRRS